MNRESRVSDSSATIAVSSDLTSTDQVGSLEVGYIVNCLSVPNEKNSHCSEGIEILRRKRN